MVRPTLFPDFALNDVVDSISGQSNVVEPPTSQKNNGWLRKQRPPRQYMNWIHRFTNNWLKYFDSNIVLRGNFFGFNYFAGPATGWQVWMGGALQGHDTLRYYARDMLDRNVISLLINNAFLKDVHVNWTLGFGANAGGKPTNLSLVANTFYPLFIIGNAAGQCDMGIDDSLFAVNLLATSGFTYARRIGYICTNATNDGLKYMNTGDIWPQCFVKMDTQTLYTDVAVTVSGSGLSYTVPTPVGVEPYLYYQFHSSDNGDWQVSLNGSTKTNLMNGRAGQYQSFFHRGKLDLAGVTSNVLVTIQLVGFFDNRNSLI